jgi:hypothetical protein
MSSNWKPWWEKVAEINDPKEYAEFMRGVGGGQPRFTRNAVLLGFVATYAMKKLTKGNK